MIGPTTKDYARDDNSRALINKNKQAFNQYKTLKARNQKIDNLEAELTEIKAILKQLLNRK